MRAERHGYFFEPQSDGVARLPPPGEVCIAQLAGGVHAWVVRHRSGDVSVVAGDHAVEPRHARTDWVFAAGAVRDVPPDAPTYNAIRGYAVPTAWEPSTRSFGGQALSY